ncbi:MAG: calcium/sodium antiporter [Deltaproteobacteria bacterium]|nr:calcium/sodium antiporter [Deltaproteobacteria bacterium]
MLADIFLLIVGLTIVVAGGEVMVRGASSLARGLGVSPLAIGLTVVAFGTSAPELAVNIGAALSDTGALSFGNVFGSNMANIGLIVGLVAVMSPIPIHNLLIRRELPMLLLATAAAVVMAFDVELGAARNAYLRTDGIILLLFFVVFSYYTVGDLIRRRERLKNNNHPAGADDDSVGAPLVELPIENDGPTPRVTRDLGLTVLGIVGLVGGAEITVSAAVDLARALEVPEVLLGLTIVSIGTSLPELGAGISCVRHGRHDMAVGSVVGSNIFNTLLVAGVSSTIRPMAIPPGGHVDLMFTALLTLLFTLTASTNRNVIVRGEGFTLLACYLAYITWRSIGFAAGP